MSKIGIFIGIIVGSAAAHYASDVPLIICVPLGIAATVALLAAPNIRR